MLNATSKSQGINHAETWTEPKQDSLDHIQSSAPKENISILHRRSDEWSLSNGPF